MENKKRKGYTDSTQQVEANKRYYNTNPEAKEKRRIANAKSGCYKYINEYASEKDLIYIRSLIDKKIKIIR